MKQEFMEVLQHCYAHSPSIVQIMDLNWYPLWCNREGLLIPDLPRYLGVSPDHDENGCLKFLWNRRMHECRLLCNRIDGYRIAEISPINTAGSITRLDVEAITASVQSMHSACHTLYAELDEHELYDQTPLLNILMGNCYRIYRMAFLQREIERLEEGKRNPVHFLANAQLRTLYDRMRNILRTCAEVEMELCDTPVHLLGDQDEFTMAMMCALLLCYREKRRFQHIEIRLEAGEEEARATFAITPGEELPPNAQGVNTIDVSTDDGEKALLTFFCNAHGGKWLVAEDHASGCVRCTVTFRMQKQCDGDLVLFSPGPERESRFYNKYDALLSRICYRNMF